MALAAASALPQVLALSKELVNRIQTWYCQVSPRRQNGSKRVGKRVLLLALFILSRLLENMLCLNLAAMHGPGAVVHDRSP